MKTLIHITITFVIFGIHNLLGSATLQNGLVGHWKFDETSGTTAYDSSGNEYDAILYGTSSGSASWVDGKVGGAIDLDGSNDYLAIKDLHFSQPGQIPAVSISVWIKSSKSSEAYIVSYDRSENWRLSMGGMNNNKKLFFATSNNANGTSDKYGATILNDNNWHHLVVTYDKVTSQKMFYLDGSVDATYTVHSNKPLGRGAVTRYGTIGTTNEDSTFNDSSTTRQDYFNGLLDDLRIYDRAVTISEVGWLYSLGNRYGDPDGDGLYNFEEETLGTNPILADTDGDGITDSVEVQKSVTFQRITGNFNFNQAVLDAENRGGHLATITSATENNAVKAVATGSEWVGGSDTEVEGTWQWVTGEDWTYSNWNSGEPNNSGNEDGLEFYANTGKWNDIPTSSLDAYILEKPGFTEISDPLNPDSDGNGYSDLLDKGLLAWYLFENNTYDMSGNNRHGTLSGSPTFSNAIQGRSLSLDGVDDYMDIAHDSSLDPRREISISMWLKIASLEKLWTPAFYKGPGPNHPNRSYALWLKESHRSFHAVSADSQGQQEADSNSNTWTTNQWYHTVTVINRNLGHIKFYLDGTLLTSGTVRTTDTLSSTNALRIGDTQEINSNYQSFHGSIDNLRIYDYAISQDLVSEIYEIESNASISIVNISDYLPDGLHAYYKLDGNANEETDNEFDGSLTGTEHDPTNAPDRFNRPNRAYYFDGNDRLKLDHRALDNLSNFSISMWAKIETFEKIPLLLSAAKSGSSHNECFFFHPSGDGYKIYFQEDPSNETLDLESSVGLSNWRNLTLTRESVASSTNFYIDGNLAKTFTFSSSTAPVDVATGGLWLGADQDSVGGGWENQQHFKGWLDEIRFYNRALNASEVNTIFEVTRLISSDFTNVDDTAPIIILNGNSNITHEAGDFYVDANASWTDAVDGSGILIATGQVNASVPGTYILSYNYTDEAGNAAQTVVRTVNVVDTTAPVITLNGDANVTHEAGELYADDSASWADAVDGNGTLDATGEVNASVPGTYTLIYNFTDAAGNVAQTVTRTVNVVDTIAPAITLNGDATITHEASDFYVDDNASWTDAVDGSGTLDAAGEVNASIPGTYILSYNFTDAAGNVAQTVTRTVNVVDTIAPVISLNGDANITHEAGFVYVDDSASWTDAVDGNGTLDAIGEVNASILGSYTLSYNFTDAAGNVAQTVTRTVNVVDTTAPAITLNGDANVTHEAGFVYVDGNASWTDAVDGSGVLVATGGVNASVPGTYELAYHYTDEAGNEADTVIRKVHVINLAPYDLGFFSDSNLSIYENEPGGTWIADFEGVDGNPDSVLTYHLMGVWDAKLTQEANLSVESTDATIEDVFDLNTNGSLTTVRPLDYEKDPIFFEILIRVTDQHGAYSEKPFLVSLLNEVEDLDEDGVEDHYDLDDDGDGQTDELEIRLGLDPRDRFDHAHAGMVFTLDVEYLENDEYRLRGELLTDGKASPVEYGFILTSTDQNSTLYTVAADENGSMGEEFTKVVRDLDRGKSYVYQAYVINELGMGVGQMKWIRKIVEAKLPEIFKEAEELDGGWHTSWMGEFWMGEERKWFYHLSLGWVFLSEDGQGGVWIWREPDGWLWTTPGVWPFLWSQDTANWTYLIENLSIPRLYDYSRGGLR